VALGLTESLARPGGNITGFTECERLADPLFLRSNLKVDILDLRDRA
jgi:ABC-type uncharacterized transport system substrate-binding protein